MTRMLARVADADDARMALEGGVDAIELRLASLVPGAVFDPAGVRAVRAAFPGPLRLRIDAPERQPGAVEAAIAFGADEIAVPAGSVADAAAVVRAAASAARPVALVALMAVEAERSADAERGAAPPASPAQSIILEAPDGCRLIGRVAIDHLDAFARRCRADGLPFGFAGGLEAPDVARLLLLQPDLLAFDIALRRDHRAGAPFDRRALAAIRVLIPREAPGPTSLPADGDATDVVFVRDFVALLSIGAYQAERGVRQRVRFSVEADVRRPDACPSDMAGVFSYDIIIETIRVLAARAHVTFVETLAEDLAAILLAYPQLSAVTVTVEKLDVIEGAVGVVVRRDRRSLLPGAGR